MCADEMRLVRIYLARNAHLSCNLSHFSFPFICWVWIVYFQLYHCLYDTGTYSHVRTQSFVCTLFCFFVLFSTYLNIIIFMACPCFTCILEHCVQGLNFKQRQTNQYADLIEPYSDQDSDLLHPVVEEDFLTRGNLPKKKQKTKSLEYVE